MAGDMSAVRSFSAGARPTTDRTAEPPRPTPWIKSFGTGYRNWLRVQLTTATRRAKARAIAGAGRTEHALALAVPIGCGRCARPCLAGSDAMSAGHQSEWATTLQPTIDGGQHVMRAGTVATALVIEQT